MDELSDYRIDRWGNGYFAIGSKGNVVVRPQPNGPAGDLHALVASLVEGHRAAHSPALQRHFEKPHSVYP